MNTTQTANTDHNYESQSSHRSSPSRSRVILCWCLHLYTALGLPINLLALSFLTQGDAKTFFVLNMFAVIIDATDGTLARYLKVKEVIPHFDGAKLDDLIDYLTFSFLPIVALAYLELVPWSWWPLLGAMLIASAYGFCQESAKTEDSFVGFPSYWNLVVVHIYLLAFPLWLIMGLLIFLSVLTFVPVHFVYPTRNQTLMKTTIVGGVIYTLTLLFSVFPPFEEFTWWGARLSLLYPIYYTILSIFHHRRIHSSLVVQTR